MLRRTIAILAAGTALLGATAAHAETRWSIGINLPPADLVVSNGARYYEPAPVYYAPPPVVRYVPEPRYVQRDYYYAPAPRVVYERSYNDRRWERRDDRWDDRRWDGRSDRHDHWDRDRDHDGPRRGR
jgi:hypothetical protein